MTCTSPLTWMTAALAIGLPACGASDDAAAPAGGSDAGPGVAIEVAPLDLPGVTNASYLLTVENALDQVVWTRSVDSASFGDGAGSLSYVGPCDADANPNTVSLTVEALYGGSAGTALLTDWVDPGTLTRSVACEASGDVSVVFDLTLMRQAQQGFFDIAVSLDDLFCSAKVDCAYEDGQPIHLLHDPDGSGRGPTVVVAFACTAGPGEIEATALHASALSLTCDDGDGGVNAHTLLPLDGPGNAGPSAPEVFQHAVYRGVEQLPGVNKCYWNTAIGLDPAALAGTCQLTGKATVSAGGFPTGATPTNTTYPVVVFDVPIGVDGEGELDCGENPVGSADVRLEYVHDAEPFDFELSCDAAPPIPFAPGLRACGQIGSEDAELIGLEAGVMLRAGDIDSPVYPLPAGATLETCCLTAE